MNASEIIYQALVELAGGHIYPLQIPEAITPPMPYIVYTPISF
ncbi:hypothetical protein ACE01C_02875 [Moraxella sp. ZJ171]